MSLLILDKKNFDQEVLKSDVSVLVDFWAPWCQNCLLFLPSLEELAEKYKKKIKIVKVDLGQPDGQEFIEKYQVQSLPNLKFFKDGKIIKELTGLKTKEDLEREIKLVISN